MNELIYRGEEMKLCMRATSNIPAGTLLMIEHVYSSNDINDMYKGIMIDESLFDNLKPKKYLHSTFHKYLKDGIWLDRTTRRCGLNILTAECTSKLYQNLLEIDNYFIIGKYISNFTHRCNPNCYPILLMVGPYNNKVNTVVCGVYACEDIKANSELTICYTGKHINKNMADGTLIGKYLCSCSCTKKETEMYVDNIKLKREYCLERGNNDLKAIYTVLHIYINSDQRFINCIINQYLIQIGMGLCGKNTIFFPPVLKTNRHRIHDKLREKLRWWILYGN